MSMMYWRVRSALVIVFVWMPGLNSTNSLPRPALGMGVFFNLRAASPDDEDGPTVLHEVSMAREITANEIVFTKAMVFNIGLFPVELLIESRLHRARTQRCAGEGKLIFGLTHLGPMLPERGLWCQY